MKDDKVVEILAGLAGRPRTTQRQIGQVREPCYSIEEVARACGVSVRAVQSCREAGILPEPDILLTPTRSGKGGEHVSKRPMWRKSTLARIVAAKDRLFPGTGCRRVAL